MFRRIAAALAVTAGLALAGPVQAQDGADGQVTPAQCAAAYDACVGVCADKHAPKSPGMMGCEARCAAERAACEARAGYNEAKPWVEDQFRKMQEFFEGFRDGGAGEDAAPESDSETDGTGDTTPKEI